MASKVKATTATTAPTTNGDLPKGWRMVRFGEVVRDVNEAERNPLDAGLERFVGLEHIEPENLHLKQWGLLADGDISFTKRFRKGQVLFGKRRAYQRKVAVAEFDGICSSDILTFEPKGEDLLPALLPFIVQSEGFFEHALGTSSGSLSPRTRWSQLQDYEFPLPPKDEQRRIADILWAADELKTQLEESIVRADATVSVYRDSIVGSCDLTNTVNLESVCELITKGESPGWQGFDYVESGPLFVTSENVGAGIYLPIPQKHIPSQFHQKLRRSALAKDDVLINLVGASIGRACVFPLDATQANVNQAVAVVRVDSQELMPKFLLSCVLSRHGLAQIFGSRVDSARPNVSLTNVRELRIPLLSINEQKRFVTQIDALEDVRNGIGNHLKAVVQMTKALRNQLIHGATHAVH